MKILVLDGDSRASLAIVRSLGRKGHEMHVGSTRRSSLAGSSRYTRSIFQFSESHSSPERFVQSLLAYIKKAKIDIVIPVTDVIIFKLLPFRDIIEKYCILPIGPTRSLKIAADKSETFRLAQKNRIPIPETFWLKSKNELSTIDRNLNFPVVIKPGKSRIFHEGKWYQTSVSYANTSKELNEIIQEKKDFEFPLLLQEKIEGPGIGLFYLFHNGKCIAHFSHQRIREKPPSGGVSTYRTSISPNPVALQSGEKILTSLNWSGVAMVEFKLDNRDKIPKLMEINGRFWGSLQLAIDSGVDFPHLLVASVTNQQYNNVTRYRTGVHLRWLLGDLDSLIMYMFKNKNQLNLPSSHKSKMSYLLDFLNFFKINDRLEVLRFSDLKPFIYELSHWIER